MVEIGRITVDTGLPEWKSKFKLYPKSHLRFKDTDRLTVEGQKRMHCTNSIHKKADALYYYQTKQILKHVTGNRGTFYKEKGSTHQEETGIPPDSVPFHTDPGLLKMNYSQEYLCHPDPGSCPFPRELISFSSLSHYQPDNCIPSNKCRRRKVLLERYHLATTVVITVSGKNHQWMPNLIEKK